MMRSFPYGKLALAFLFLFLIVIGGLAWPVYGFFTHKEDQARLPFGWVNLPQDPAPQVSEVYDARFTDIDQLALDLLETQRQAVNAPSLSAAIAFEGELIWAGAVGWRDIDRALPVTLNTRYRIGSTSKAVTATGLARQVTLGHFNLDTPIHAYMPDLPNSDWNAFTLRRLGSHTAGLPDYQDNTDWLGLYQSVALQSHYDTSIEALSVFDGSALYGGMGEQFRYSGYDNVLISAVMETQSELDFESLMQAIVFDPHQLTSMAPAYDEVEDYPLAAFYLAQEDKLKPWRPVDVSHRLAAGGFGATPSDIARLGAAWLDDAFIAPEVRHDFWQPVALNSGDINPQNYAVGFRQNESSIEGIGGYTYVHHGGVGKGAQSWFMIIPEHQLSLSLMINRRTEPFFAFAEIDKSLIELVILSSQDNILPPQESE